MKTEIFVILEHGYLEDDPYYGMADWVETTQGYAFDDYEKARYWVLEWVKEYNKTIKRTIPDGKGGFIESDEPVLVETEKDIWGCFDACIEILKIGEIDIDKIEATDKVCLS
jgi:hypothetical protein